MSCCKKGHKINKSFIKKEKLRQIEKLRDELYEMAKAKGEWDREVLKKSQELDNLMNKLHKVKDKAVHKTDKKDKS